mgnify:CR=1 FL=1
MENVADADAAWLDARIRAAWDALVFEFPRPGNPDPEWRDAWKSISRLSGTKRGQAQRQTERMLAKLGQI